MGITSPTNSIRKTSLNMNMNMNMNTTTQPPPPQQRKSGLDKYESLL
jgi:hypothetical protein